MDKRVAVILILIFALLIEFNKLMELMEWGLKELNTILNFLPDRYYERAKEVYGSKAPKIHDINTLYNVLITIKLPRYEMDFDCSESSAALEWILEGYGFKTYIASADVAPPGARNPGRHTWVIVELDNHDRVAIEATMLAENRYRPPGIIVDPSQKYLQYSYIYQEYKECLKKCSNGFFHRISGILSTIKKI